MAEYRLTCRRCGSVYRPGPTVLMCPQCVASTPRDGFLHGVLRIDISDLPDAWPEYPVTSAEFLNAFLPLDPKAPKIVFPVGGTPLLPVHAMRQRLRMPQLWLKDDTRNPSGSTKDRASFLVVAKAMQYGFDTVATASTGNAATALAACGAAAGLDVVVFVPAAAPANKLRQILAYGARLLPVRGTYDQAFDLSIAACRAFGWYNRNTAWNPYTIEGKKTVALEIAAQMGGRSPDVVIVPTGDGVILTGVAKGFADLKRVGLVPRVPRLIAVQPEGACAIARAWRDSAAVEPHPKAHSIADSLTVECPRNALWCLDEIRQSHGAAVIVGDEAIAQAIVDLGARTGVFAEPAGAAALAGLQQALNEGLVDRDERVVLLITGHGLKDPTAAADLLHLPEAIEPSVEAVQRKLHGR